MSPVVFENEFFRVERAASCFVPGYLVVSAKESAASLAELKGRAASALGPLLVRVTRAIEEVVSPEVVYCARFGEKERQVHFHLFPRSARLAAEYRSANSSPGSLDGPCLLSWARERYILANSTEAELQEVRKVGDAIRAILEGASEGDEC